MIVVQETSKKPNDAGQGGMTVRVDAISPEHALCADPVGFAGDVYSVDSETMPFIAGDQVFGICSAVEAPRIGTLLTVDPDLVARKPRSLHMQAAADLARYSVISWLVLFEQLDLGTAVAGSVALIQDGGTPLTALLIGLTQHLTEADLVLATEEGSRLVALLRTERDRMVTSPEELVNSVRESKAGPPRYLVLAGAAVDSRFSIAEIVSLYRAEQEFGSLRVIDLAWVANLSWSDVANSRLAVSDILAEVRSLVDQGKLVPRNDWRSGSAGSEASLSPRIDLLGGLT